MSEKQNIYSIESLLQHAPAGIGLAGVIAIVLSYVYQAAYFAGRGVNAMDNLGVSDLADRAGIAVTAAVIILCTLFVAHKFATNEAKKIDLKKQQVMPDWLRNTSTWATAATSIMLFYGAYRSGWDRVVIIMFLFQTVNFILFFLMDRGFFTFLGFRNSTAVLCVISVISLPALLGAMAGAFERRCPTIVNLSMSDGGAIHGVLVANLNRGVVFIEYGTGAVAVIPWSQITRYSEKVCVAENSLK